MPERRLDGRYRVEAFVRGGRFGDLWQGRRAEKPNEQVTLKLLRPELFKDGEAIRRFQREVRLLLGFEHPYLLQVLDHGLTESGDPYLVLEPCDGVPLSELVARDALPIARVRRIGAQIARVLAAGAMRGIVHRGLCPDAILVKPPHDDVKVTDMGLATVRNTGEPDLTETGQRLGDPAYMAPEYIDRFQVDARTDAYALGILLYELATGDPPFVGSALAVLDAHVSRVPDAPSTKLPGIPEWFDVLVLALLDKAAVRRPTATDASRSLVSGCWPPPSDGTGPVPLPVP